MAQEQLIRSVYNALNSHDLEKFVSFFADEGQFKNIASEKVFRGKKEIRAMAEGWLKAFPDMKLQILNLIGEGEIYCAETTLVGTHTGPLDGPQGVIPASGKKVNTPACDVIRLKNGKIQSLNCYLAATVLMSQIGAMPGQIAA